MQIENSEIIHFHEKFALLFCYSAVRPVRKQWCYNPKEIEGKKHSLLTYILIFRSNLPALFMVKK